MTTEPVSLERRSMLGAVRFVLFIGGPLFLAAGTLRYWYAWAYVGMQAVSVVATTAYLLRYDRALMERRLAADERGEQERIQKVFMVLLSVLGVGMLVVSGLDRRFGWSAVPLPAVISAFLVFAGAALLIFLVMRENTFASSVIEVEAAQRVVGTGPYRLVRHPMYTGMLLGIAATPLALGSYYAEVFVLPLFGLFVMRLLAEERFLRAFLPGYADYMEQTRERLVPGLW